MFDLYDKQLFSSMKSGAGDPRPLFLNVFTGFQTPDLTIEYMVSRNQMMEMASNQGPVMVQPRPAVRVQLPPFDRAQEAEALRNEADNFWEHAFPFAGRYI